MSFPYLATIGVFILAFSLSSSSRHPWVSVHVRAKNSNGTTVGKFSIFNLLRGRFTLLPSFRSLPHYALLVLAYVAMYMYPCLL